MGYEKQNWTTGEVITADKLNHMEDGIAGCGVLVCNITVDGNTGTLDHTWQEIHDAPIAVIKMPNNNEVKTLAICTLIQRQGDNDYVVEALIMVYPNHERFVFDATSADGYPSATIDGEG